MLMGKRASWQSSECSCWSSWSFFPLTAFSHFQSWVSVHTKTMSNVGRNSTSEAVDLWATGWLCLVQSQIFRTPRADLIIHVENSLAWYFHVQNYQEFITFSLGAICKVYAYECYINSYLDLSLMHKILGTCKYEENFRNSQILKLLVPSIFGLYLLDWKKPCIARVCSLPKSANPCVGPYMGSLIGQWA